MDKQTLKNTVFASIDEVCDGICKKLILRHPHIFGTKSLDTSDQVLDMWEQIKRKEKKQETVSQSIDQIAKTLPALIYAEKVQKKVVKSGITTVKPDNNDDIGEKLFSVVWEAREKGIDPEKALCDATNRFIARFNEAEKAAD